MYTGSKGQGMIAEIILFGMAIMMAIFMFIMLSSEDALFEQNVETEIESGMESVGDRSALTVILNDNVWRAPTVNERYGDLKALELSSHYLSTDEEVHIHGEDHDRDKVKSDLETYYRFKMEANFLQRPEQQDFVLNITDDSGEYIAVEDIDDRGGTWNSIRVPYQLSAGRSGEITMWVRGTGGVFRVQ